MCVSYIYYRVPVYCVYVLVIVDFLLLSFKLSLGYLFSPHHVNQGGVQKTTPQVTLYKSHTAKESLRRRRTARHNQVLSGHADQAWELFLVLLPQHARVCVLGHLLHSHVCIYFGLPVEEKYWLSQNDNTLVRGSSSIAMR